MNIDLDKVLRSWQHVITKGQFVRELEEHIIHTIVLLEELKDRREKDNEKD